MGGRIEERYRHKAILLEIFAGHHLELCSFLGGLIELLALFFTEQRGVLSDLWKTLLGQPDRVDIRRCQGFNQVIGLNRHHIDRSRNRPVLRQLHPR